MREADISEYGIVAKVKRVSNLRFADDAVLMDEKKDSITELVRRVNTVGERRLLK